MSVQQEELQAILALRHLPGIGDHIIRQLAEHCGSASEVFRLPKSRLLKIPGIGPKTADILVGRKAMESAEREIDEADRRGTRIIAFTDPAFPARLRDIPDAPAILYIEGNFNINQKRVLAVAGTRKATAYGRRIVRELIQELAHWKPLIISGLAYGIDVEAHRAALDNGLPTVAVLGSGMDVIYPSAHSNTAARMLESGGLITEQSFGAAPDAHNFPARNRIIAGLCDGLLVVEAADSGGAIITAALANSYHKDVFAVPGNIGQIYSAGCNRLIRDHQAALVTSGRDIAAHLGWDSGKSGSVSRKTIVPSADGLPEECRKVLEWIPASGTISLEHLLALSGMPHGTMASALLQLECSSLVESLPGKLLRACRK